MAEPVPLRLPAETPGAGRRHAFINALIEELPAPGSDWSAPQRAIWLELMGKALALAYGGAAEGAAKAIKPAEPRAGAVKVKYKPKPPKGGKRPPPDAGFYIDGDGFARDHKGNRILPADVAGPLVDHRGEHGDLGAIRWADETRGIPRGMQIDVTIAAV